MLRIIGRLNIAVCADFLKCFLTKTNTRKDACLALESTFEKHICAINELESTEHVTGAPKIAL